MTYILDTNIILDSVENLLTLSDNNTNTLVIPETVIDELDAKKTGFEDINFNARQFARLLEDSTIVYNEQVGPLHVITTSIDTLDISLKIISKKDYTCDTQTVALNILNDRKILEASADYINSVDKQSTLVSLDIMFRTRALSMGLNAEALVGKNSDVPNEFHKTIEVSNIMSLNSAVITAVDPSYVVENYSYTLVDRDTGNEKLAYVANGHLYFLDEADLGRQSVRPMNKEQKLFVNAILSDMYQIIISDAKAGSGKTLLSLATAMRLVAKKKFSNIVYVRNSIESLAKGEDVGYLPGLEEKFKIYNHPLFDSLRFIAKSELTKSNANKSRANTTVISEDTITAKVDEYIEKHRIQTMWVGEMRGRTISDAIVIVDEIQNCSASTGQLILSRLDKNCKVICIGSNRQIDNLYTNKYINSLSFLLKAAKSLHEEVSLFAIELNRVLRGPITEWSEKIFTRK